MTPVKDQGACGSCAAFAATATLEGTINKRAGNVDKETFTHISEQHLVDCTMDTEKTRQLFGELEGGYNYGCSGGYMTKHWDFIQEHGAMKNEDYPYNASVGECNHDFDKIYGKVASSHHHQSIFGRNSVETMMEVVAEQPVAAALHASSREFQLYQSGVLKSCCDYELDPDCDETSLEVNHAITIVGYKVKKNGKGFWHIQNSWGADWGNDGFMKLDMNEVNNGTCNINSHGVFSVEADFANI